MNTQVNPRSDELEDDPSSIEKTAVVTGIGAAIMAPLATKFIDAPTANATEAQEELHVADADYATSTSAAPSTASTINMDQEILEATNKARAAEGLDPVELNAEMSSDSTTYAQFMSSTKTFEHAEGNFSENIAKSTAKKTAEQLVQDWLDSPGHRANIMDKDVTMMGAGVVHDDNGTHAVQRFF
ncbi:CAP domain-containing protein [Corynebacterium mastitidis]|uniref:CAP domain-containing protein n=1 Tax=Corynebacterium mastitidis TaxID=161890 RepID=UPI00254A9BB8|nr:CAP domain-containing protein [Corynebacterium mastitidis]MDK8451154.1 CAP domain-containing protein [Corynebacterium mastitidis]